MIRGFMLDSARCQEKYDYYRRFLDFAAARGMNTLLWHFTDDQGCSMQFECEPAIASPNAFTQKEMRQLISHARALGIDVIPEVASLGHTVYITRLPQYRDLTETTTSSYSGICPLSPITRKALKSLIEETASVFDSPNFHVGMDEANIGEHPLTREALTTHTKGQLFADHVNFLHGIVTGLNKRMWMWGDALLHDDTIAPQIPGDIVICNWRYMPNAETSTTQYFLDAGFDVVLCSALISHNQTLFPAETYALPNIRSLKQHEKLTGSGKVLGSVCTIWTPIRYIAESLWLGLNLASSIMREDSAVETTAAIQQFARDYYGLQADDTWLKACTEICGIAPERDELFALFRLQNLDTLPGDAIATRAQRWDHITHALQQVLPSVRQHQNEYAAFILMTELLAYLYKAADRVSQRDHAGALKMTAIGHQLLGRLDAAWNQERFADDLRKYCAPVPHFQDEHLLPLLRDHVAKFESLTKEFASKH